MNAGITLRLILKVVSLSVLLFAVLVYVIFQARFLIVGPQIVLVEDPYYLQNTQQIELTGSAFNISHLWMNDRPIYTDAQGNFKEALVLENGYTITTLRAEDRYGRTTTLTRSFVYVPMTFIQ